MKQHRLAAAITLVGLVLVGCDKQPEGKVGVAKAADTPKVEATQSGADTKAADVKAAETKATTPLGEGVKLETPAQKASYGVGLNIGQSLAQDGMDLDSKALVQGIEDAIAKQSPRLTDEEIKGAFEVMQKREQERMAKLNEESLATGRKFLEENGKRQGVITTKSGLQYEIVKKAEGAQPKASDVVSVHYEGKLIDGTVFDSSIQRGAPIDLPVGGVIPGWVEALQLMHVGEEAKLYIPSELAYGAQSPSPSIPANSVLVFDLQLLGIKKDEKK